ncbi:MAG: ribosome recycling factor [Parcubacteria bacterium C7867-006]|nr:MAG: ribosome recycling factor [Parcubacteria bacterium C7867-006]
MAYNLPQFKQSLKDVEEWLKKEFTGIRTGRATPAILDGVKVDAYGTEMPINQVANISVEDARMLRITPWDASQVKAIEKAIMVSDLGLSVSVDDKGLRVNFPELTSDRRAALIKIAKQKLEDARVTVRTEREKAIKDIDGQEKEKKISEDEKFRMKADLQKVLDDVISILDELFAKKEKEITE